MARVGEVMSEWRTYAKVVRPPMDEWSEDERVDWVKRAIRNSGKYVNVTKIFNLMELADLESDLVREAMENRGMRVSRNTALDFVERAFDREPEDAKN